MTSTETSTQGARQAADVEGIFMVWAGRCALTAALAVLLGAITWAARGLRGSDQYWYAADLINRNSTVGLRSNHLYPSFSLSDAARDASDLPPRIHGVPATWAAEGAFALGASDYHSWVIVNALLALATAVACYAVARMLGMRRAAVWAPALFLSFPLTTWLTLNALADMSLAFFASVLLLGVVAADRFGARWGLLLGAVASGLLFWTRENFVLVVIGHIIFCAWLYRRRAWSFPPVALASGVAISFLFLRSVVFPKYPTSGLEAALMVSAPGSVRGMDMYYASVDFQLGPFAAKLASGALSAVLPSGAVEVFTESTLIVGLALAAVILLRAGERHVVTWLLGLFVVYVATCMLYQSQNRYIYVLAPMVSVAVALALNRSVRWGRRANWTSAVGAFTVLGFLAGSALMAQQYRSSSIDETHAIESLQGTLAGTRGPLLSTGSNVSVIATAYAAAPRVVLVADADLNSTTEVATLLKRWGPQVVLGPSSDGPFLTSAVQQAFPGATLRHLGTAPTPDGELELWNIDPAAPPGD